MDLSNLNIKNLDHLGLVAGLCQELGISQIIDKLIPSSANDNIISTGKYLETMVLNGLGFTGRTLHMYSQYFEDKPIQRLLGIDIKAEQINDDAEAIDQQGKIHKGLFTLRNSWGSHAGDEGNYYVSYDYFKSWAFDLTKVIQNPFHL